MNGLTFEALVVFKTVGDSRPVPVQASEVPAWVKDPEIIGKMAEGYSVSDAVDGADPDSVVWWSAIKVEDLRRRAKGLILH